MSEHMMVFVERFLLGFGGGLNGFFDGQSWCISEQFGWSEIPLSDLACSQRSRTQVEIECTNERQNMITIDAFLVFLFASSLPVVYLLIMRHFIEGGGSKIDRVKTRQAVEKSADHSRFVHPTASGLAASH